MTKLLTASARLLAERGFVQTDSVTDRVEGTPDVTYTAFRWPNSGEEFLVRAKEYIYKGRASFGADQVDHALEAGAMLVIYDDESASFTAFDPAHVDERGTVVHGQSKLSESREWVEVPMGDGADLFGYIDGTADPERTDDRRAQGSLGDFGGP